MTYQQAIKALSAVWESPFDQNPDDHIWIDDTHYTYAHTSPTGNSCTYLLFIGPDLQQHYWKHTYSSNPDVVYDDDWDYQGDTPAAKLDHLFWTLSTWYIPCPPMQVSNWIKESLLCCTKQPLMR